VVKTPAQKQSKFPTLAEVFTRLGNVPPHRVLSYPAPGTAWLGDLIDPGIISHRVVEHIDGILVEKMSDNRKFQITLRVMSGMFAAVETENTGAVLGPKCRVLLRHDLIRVPDVTFVRWDSVDDTDEIERPAKEWLSVTPHIVVEVLSESNTPREMQIKLAEYAAAGVKLVWYVDPDAKTVTVYPKGRERGKKVLGVADTLDGGKVLPGFSLPVADLFAPRAPKGTKKGKGKGKK
jgi:Uma2 family endonuclease